VDFLNFQKSNFVRGKFLKIRSSINQFPEVMLGRSHTEFAPDRFSRFNVWIQANRQTDKQSLYINVRSRILNFQEQFFGHPVYRT